tara:strand:- start:999 stop:1673 length:675 start_codon:yes stop_codon:yes gene_type:complete
LNKKSFDISYGVQPFLAILAMWVTQDILMRYFFRNKIIQGREYLEYTEGSLILAPTHRSRWDGLILTYATGRRVTKKDCRFMVTTPEMKGIQGWFLRRLGCFSINQEFPSMFSLRYAINLILSQNQLVIFPEGKINKYGKKVQLKQGLFRLAKLAMKRGAPVKIVPIGIAYSQIKPKLGCKVALCIEKPLNLKDFANSSIGDFNAILFKSINDAELKALSLVGR